MLELATLQFLLLFYRPLVTQLFVACAPYGVEPVRQHALALRDRLAHQFPKLFAPGILFNSKNGDDGWSNGDKKKDILMDNVFAAIEARFTEEKKENHKDDSKDIIGRPYKQPATQKNKRGKKTLDEWGLLTHVDQTITQGYMG